LFCELIGAIASDVFTWYFGLPTSSSHALVGGYAGAAVAAYGGIIGVLKPEGWIKTTIFIFASPMIGMVLGFFILLSILWIVKSWSPVRVSAVFRKGQLLSAAMYSLGHGGADAQKTMGIIAAVLVDATLNAAAGKNIPMWVVIS